MTDGVSEIFVKIILPAKGSDKLNREGLDKFFKKIVSRLYLRDTLQRSCRGLGWLY